MLSPWLRYCCGLLWGVCIQPLRHPNLFLRWCRCLRLPRLRVLTSTFFLMILPSLMIKFISPLVPLLFNSSHNFFFSSLALYDKCGTTNIFFYSCSLVCRRHLVLCKSSLLWGPDLSDTFTSRGLVPSVPIRLLSEIYSSWMDSSSAFLLMELWSALPFSSGVSSVGSWMLCIITLHFP